MQPEKLALSGPAIEKIAGLTKSPAKASARLRAAAFMAVGAVASLFGIIHSPLPGSEMFLPWRIGDRTSWRIAAGYLVFALVLAIFHFSRPSGRSPADTTDLTH